MRMQILGCGYLGRRVTQRWLTEGHEVTAVTRSAARAAEWRREGLRPIVGDVLDPSTLWGLPACDVLLYAVSYDRASGGDKRRVSVEGLQNVLAAVGNRVGRLIYISSSSVYGQDAGEWVDEDSPALPQTEGGRIAAEAEAALRESRLGRSDCAVILRLTGIYGPDRVLTRVAALRDGLPLAGSPDAWLNLIHVDDAAAAVVAAARQPQPEPLYLVTDDRPCTRGEYYTELSRLVNAPPPTFDPAQVPRHGQGLNKRCRNQRIKRSLGLQWQCPTFVEGLRASL